MSDIQDQTAESVRLGKLPPLKVQKVPKFTGFKASIGAGLIWASLAMGSGELIWWPYITAKYGAFFVGLLLPSCILQYFVNQEIARYTVTTGEGMMEGFARFNHIFAILMWIMLVVTFSWFGSYVSGGATALYELTNFPAGWSDRGGSLFWSYCIIGVFFSVFIFTKIIYVVIEWIMKILIVICIISIFFTLFHPDVFHTAGDFFSAYFNPFYLVATDISDKWNPSDSSILLTCICFAGMGGFNNIMYSYWTREKGIGMGKRFGKVTNPITSKQEGIPFIGFAFKDTDENKRNYFRWIKCLHYDNFIAVMINAFMAMAICWLAWAILLPRGEYPSGWQIAVVQSKFFEISMGPIGRIIFLIIAASFLSDSWLGIVDACSRMHADYFRSIFRFAQKCSFRKIYYFFVVILTMISCITIPLAKPGPLLVLGGVCNFIAMAIYCPALIYINYFMVPKVFPDWTRPNTASLLAICIVTLIYIIISIWYIMVLFKFI